MDRAYSLLEVKNIQEDARVITGVATTPSPDRAGDIVEPLGVKFVNPMPLLHQHRSDQPVGFVTFGEPTKKGISFTARLPKIAEEGVLKNRVDTAWGEVKAGLVRGVSIGFRPIETERLDDGGLRFLKSEVMELSLVTIPANAEATIQTIKSFDQAALGQEKESVPATRVNIKGDNFTAKQVKEIVKVVTGKTKMAQTTAEKISAFEATRVSKSARMEAIMEEAGDETLDAAQSEEYDTLKEEIAGVDKHLSRLYDLQKVQVAKAKTVSGETQKAASESRSEYPRVSVKQPELAKGIGFARYAKVRALSHVLHRNPEDIAKQMYPNHDELHMVLKTDIPAANVATSLWAGALVGSETSIFADFVEYLRPLTILGQFGTGGVPSLRRVPFRTPLITQSATTTAYWVGEGQPKPMSKAGFTRTTLLPYKVAALTAATMELLRDSSPSAEAIIRDDLAKSIAAKLDTDFLDPQVGNDEDAALQYQPSSISNGLTPITSSGRDADSVRTDLVAMLSTYVTANNPASSAVWVMSAVTGLQLSMMTNAFGQPEFPSIVGGGDGRTGFNAGTFRGIPVIFSEYLGYTTDSPVQGRDVFLVNASDIYFADDGGIEVRMSSEASLEMEDGPANASAPTVAQAQLTSMFQTNSVAFLAERSVSWKRRRTEGVVHLQQVEWGENADSGTVP
jgi:HK97 family phage major capsid protein/HK97 family phage prohead protease